MQTALIIRTLKIIPPKTDNSLVIPPQKEGNNDIKRPRASNLTPYGHGIHIHRRHDSKSRKALCDGTLALCEIDRNHDRAADNAHEDEDIAAHLGESQEDGGIKTNALDQLGFFGAQDRLEPGKNASANWRRGVLVVCMLGFRGVNDGMTGTKEGEEQGEKDSSGDGSDQGGGQGVQLELLLICVSLYIILKEGGSIQPTKKDSE